MEPSAETKTFQKFLSKWNYFENNNTHLYFAMSVGPSSSPRKVPLLDSQHGGECFRTVGQTNDAMVKNGLFRECLNWIWFCVV